MTTRPSRVRACYSLVAIVAATSCASADAPTTPSSSASSTVRPGVVLVLGDSLAVSPSRSEGFPSQLQKRLDETSRGYRLFPRLAEKYNTGLVPFLLEGVALNPDMNGDDEIHPNAAGAKRIAETVWPYLEPLVHATATASTTR